jgi:hypothetical protein
MEFSSINDFGKGKSGSFEALMKVLARREQPKDALEFQPNDGRGGDGGVEAIWIRSDGTKIGYQAKFFDSLGTSQWLQMEKSVVTALETHPELTKYVFALPFDLTPKRNQKRSGDKSQQEKWDEHVIKWKVHAAKKIL